VAAAHIREAPLWELREVAKAFPGVQALDRASLRLRTGEVHALVGENGSGKSTLVKCLAGAHQPDSGELLQRGSEVRLTNPTAARDRGVATFYQELSLVPSLQVTENICLGELPRRGPFVDWPAARRRAEAALHRLGLEIDLDRPVEELSMAERQLLEIAKAISRDMSLLILDEPTAALGPGDVRRLHDVIRALSRDTAVLYVSHRLDEIFDVADVVTVIKDGKIVGSSATAATSVSEVVRMMLGTELEEHYTHDESDTGATVLEARGLRTRTGVDGVSLTLRRGEVLGLGGMVGSRRTEIARALFGADRLLAGEIWLDGHPLKLRSPADAIRAGIGLVAENRETNSLFSNLEGPPNITIARLAEVCRGPFLSLARERKQARRLVDELRIERAAMSRSVRLLSGGNQQKVVLARWLFADARVLILDEPTQGIDIGAKQEVYRMLQELTAQGTAVLLISSDYPELLALSDRVAIVRAGRVVRVAERGELNEHRLVELAASGRAEAAA
jgi:ribose transport system ATP-binding protein